MKHGEEDKEVKEEKPEDEKNGKDETVIKEEEVEVGPEDTSGKPPEEPFGPDDKSKEDPHRVKEWRTWLDSKKELSSSARPNVITSVYNGNVFLFEMWSSQFRAHFFTQNFTFE